MFVRCLIGSVLFLMMLSMPASAQHRPQDFHGILKLACGMEINSQCKGVPDARGQLLACLFTHRATLSPRCEGIMWGSMDSLGKALGRLAQLLRNGHAGTKEHRQRSKVAGVPEVAFRWIVPTLSCLDSNQPALIFPGVLVSHALFLMCFSMPVLTEGGKVPLDQM